MLAALPALPVIVMRLCLAPPGAAPAQQEINSTYELSQVLTTHVLYLHANALFEYDPPATHLVAQTVENTGFVPDGTMVKSQTRI